MEEYSGKCYRWDHNMFIGNLVALCDFFCMPLLLYSGGKYLSFICFKLMSSFLIHLKEMFYIISLKISNKTQPPYNIQHYNDI